MAKITSDKLNESKQSKSFNLGKDKTKRTGYNCMQQRGYSNGFLSGGIFTWKSFFIQLSIGITGGLGVWYFTPAIEAIRTDDIVEPFKVVLFLISVFFVMGGLFAIYDLVKEILGF